MSEKNLKLKSVYGADVLFQAFLYPEPEKNLSDDISYKDSVRLKAGENPDVILRYEDVQKLIEFLIGVYGEPEAEPPFTAAGAQVGTVLDITRFIGPTWYPGGEKSRIVKVDEDAWQINGATYAADDAYIQDILDHDLSSTPTIIYPR